ncbi:uncharacterized protein BDZ99DRAFT_481501 [Mytilinidion resinicola]|uniref:Uncharacterized protein n=1 Tax=Mytilinidion resinicola TaxID=574789 RepID=A0A6A6Y5V9_9PEZI|nr:uncharacterized protein BDZ99DRAFT_481501 [Mytilinidion resinicola]KAF2803913.1 hypothetical protein BDZ99DRAFT_481501 [Mytilinidion resinicola]
MTQPSFEHWYWGTTLLATLRVAIVIGSDPRTQSWGRLEDDLERRGNRRDDARCNKRLADGSRSRLLIAPVQLEDYITVLVEKSTSGAVRQAWGRPWWMRAWQFSGDDIGGT